MIYKKHKYNKSLGYGIHFFKEPFINPKTVAVLIKFGRYGFWIFKNQQIVNNWPQTNG